MRRILLLSLIAFAGSAAAQPRAPNEVAPVTVMPDGPAAKLTGSYPAAGAAVPGGVLILKATFDQPMEPLSFTLTGAPGGEPVECLKEARLLENGRTFVLLCRVRPSSSYALALSARGAGGKSAAPVTLAFTTTASAPVNNIRAAMKAAELGDTDMPVIETPGLPAGG